MSWFNLWDGLKTKTCRYLLHRYLGQFFENNLNLEQLKVDLYNGKAVVENISLKVNALNDLFEDQGWAFEVVSGHIGCLSAMVPWNALMTNDSTLNITNMTITLRPVTRCQSGTTMLESMWSSVSSSMQMAEECMKQIDDDIPFLNHNNTLIGLEKFAETIDNVLNRIHANLTNTTLNIEYALPKSSKKLIISFRANHVEYKNQTGYGKYSTFNEEQEDKSNNLTSLPMIAKHDLLTNDLTIYTSEIINSDSLNAEFETYGRLCKIVELKGCQNFKISIKQTENIVGPKINLDVIIDDIYFMLTPRQAHLLFRISKGFNKESPKHKMFKKYKDLGTEISNTPNITKMTGVVEKDGVWCTASDSIKRSEYIYTDLKKTKKCESVLSSTSTNSMTTSCGNAQINIACAEKSGEIVKFKMQICKIVGVILHNDILVETTHNIGTNNKYIFSNESFVKYSHIANIFFANTCMEEHLRESNIPIRNMNYLLFAVSSLLVNGNQQRFCHELTSKTTLSATIVDFSEIVDNVENFLILFDRKKNCQEGYHTRPEIIVSHTSTYFFKEKYNKSSNKIECTLDDCTTEFDISIYDRLSALFVETPFLEDYDTDETKLETSNPMNMQIKCNSLKLNLRFPIVDGRLPLDPSKLPYWQKNIRNDFLLFDFRKLLIQWNSYICIIVDEAIGFYCDGNIEKAIQVMKCSYQNNLNTLTTNEEKICVEVHYSILDTLDEEMICTQNRLNQKRKSPFSSKCSYGYTSYIGGFNDSDKTDLFLPGDTEEINGFCESCKNSSSIKICASVPILKIVFESKELYEMIYNRLNGDLLMWEPRSTIYQCDEASNKKRFHLKTNLRDSQKYFDVYSSGSKEKNPLSLEGTTYDSAIFNGENNTVSFELRVKEGIVIMYPDVQTLDKRDLPSQRGKLHLNLKEFRLFSVSALNNDKNQSSFCIQIKEIDIFHCGQVFEEFNAVWTDAADTNLMHIISYLPEDQLVINNRHEIISVVAELKKQPDKRLKRIKLSFGINGAILWYSPSYEEQNWIYQLMDFLNITDFPIEAYEPYALVSEIQGHIWNFSIKYRPKYLSYRALLNIGYCSLSSNIIYPTTGCTLRLMTEDCILSIGHNGNCANELNETNSPTGCNGLVPILTVGLLNISLRLNDQNKSYPNIDLRSAIHDVHLKTCFDSADALAQLIAYIANDKDLKSIDKNKVEPVTSTDSPATNSSRKSEETHINNLMADAVRDVEITHKFKFSNNAKETKQINYNKVENSQSASYKYDNNLDAYKILDFETNVMLQSYSNQEKSENSLPQVQAELLATLTNAPALEEKDFHVIHDEDIFFMDKCGVEQIYVSEDPLRIVDNHFCSPNVKLDILRPPVHFPISQQSYTLCEMTFTWHLFGGKDFADIVVNSNSKVNTSLSGGIGMSETYKHGVSHASIKSQANLKKNVGGTNVSQRNLDVLVEIQFMKIRFSHDIYPTNSIYASRQVLVVSEIEIRDRLLSSDINKLLYHPNKNSIPQKNDENMVSVKALNIRSNLKNNRSEECSLKVSILPIRLNIDQDTLMFLEDFFSALIKRSANLGLTSNNNLQATAPDRDEPVMAINEITIALREIKLKEIKVENPTLLTEETVECGEDCLENEVHPIYFKEFIFSPALPICFDYHGRRIELSRGPITGLVMGLAQLQGSGICLREVVNRRGLLGWNKLFEFVCKEWLKDIKRNQLPNILSGIGPTNAVLQLFQGFFDLFRLPLQQYNKDGRIIRGFQLGAQSFSARTAFAALEITSRIIHLLQFTAETTFDMLSAGPSLNRRRKSKHAKKRQGRPKDLREGVANAYTIVKEGINDSANNLMEAAMVEHDQKGYSGAVGAVVRQLPQLVVCPAVLATQATTNILGGAKSSLVPEAKREARDKWKHVKN